MEEGRRFSGNRRGRSGRGSAWGKRGAGSARGLEFDGGKHGNNVFLKGFRRTMEASVRRMDFDVFNGGRVHEILRGDKGVTLKRSS